MACGNGTPSDPTALGERDEFMHYLGWPWRWAGCVRPFAPHRVCSIDAAIA